MSKFQELKQELEECMCVHCQGSGVISEPEAEELNIDVWECVACNGSGINPEFGISLDIDRG